MGVFWYVFMRRLGQSPYPYETLRAFFIGHLGKYVPGKVMVVVIRTGLIASDRVDTTIAATGVFVATLTMMAAGAFLSGVILLICYSQHVMLQCLAFGLMVGTALVTMPPTLKPIVRRLKGKHSADEVTALLNKLNWSTLAIGWGCALIAWTCYTFSLWAVLRAIPIGEPVAWDFPTILSVAASVSLAMVTGFVSLLPGGVGAREWVLDQLLVPLVGPAAAMIATVVLRLVWMVTELVLSSLLYIASPRVLRFEKRRTPHAAHES